MFFVVRPLLQNLKSQNCQFNKFISGFLKISLSSNSYTKTSMESEQFGQFCLQNGDKLPPAKPGLLRLYSMRFCPFAQRTRIVLLHKNISHEIVNIHLRNKPDWFTKLTPFGLVPVLEQADKIVYDSPACSDYLEDIYPEIPLREKNLYIRAHHRSLMDNFFRLTSQFYKILRAPSEELRDEAKSKLEKELILYENMLNNPFFGGENLGLLDVHIWPWFERFDCIQMMTDYDPLPSSKFPRLSAWRERMFQHSSVKPTTMNTESHVAFMISLAKGAADYDYGLKKQPSKY